MTGSEVVVGGVVDGTVVGSVAGGSAVLVDTGTVVEVGTDVVVVTVVSGRHGPSGSAPAGGSVGIVTRGAQPKLKSTE